MTDFILLPLYDAMQSMLRLFSIVFIGASAYTVHKLFPTTNYIAFEALTITCTICSYLFVQRADGAVKLFQAALVLALVQAAWWLYVNVYAPSILEAVPAEYNLDIHQFPMGSLFFFVAWAFDRLSVRTSKQVTEMRKEVIALEKKAL